MEELRGDQIVAWLERAADVIEREKAFLTELDAPIGDSDHGVNMARGFAAVRNKLAGVDRGDIGVIFKDVGMTLLSTVGGASGPLYGTLFLEAGKQALGRASLDLVALTNCLAAGLAGVARRGKAAPLDKTMIDALSPAVAELQALAGAELAHALGRAAEAAREGALATRPLVARKGRASYLGERSVGHQDPGATSCALILESLAAVASA
jgi:phosphoenolpyruvate---glycerone phosphotransferase subunit DhaL